MQQDDHILDWSYPPSFLSASGNGCFVRLPLLSRYELSSCVRKFRGSVSKGCRTKNDCINLIESDFMLQTNQLMRLSTPDLLRSVAVSPSIGESSPRLSLICRFIHNRYGTVIASQLLCSPTRWNPPEMTESGTPQPAWLNTPVTQLRSRLTRVDAGTVKKYCDMYAVPDPTPKSKTERYNLLIQRF